MPLVLQLLSPGLTGRWSSGPGQLPRSCSSQPASSALQQQQQARTAPALQTQAQKRADASSSSQESLPKMAVVMELGTINRRGRKRLAALSLDRTAAAGWHAAPQAHKTLAGQQLQVLSAMVLLATLCQPP